MYCITHIVPRSSPHCSTLLITRYAGGSVVRDHSKKSSGLIGMGSGAIEYRAIQLDPRV